MLTKFKSIKRQREPENSLNLKLSVDIFQAGVSKIRLTVKLTLQILSQNIDYFCSRGGLSLEYELELDRVSLIICVEQVTLGGDWLVE